MILYIFFFLYAFESMISVVQITFCLSKISINNQLHFACQRFEFTFPKQNIVQSFIYLFLILFISGHFTIFLELKSIFITDFIMHSLQINFLLMISLLKVEHPINAQFTSKKTSRSKSFDPSPFSISGYHIRQKLGMGSYAKVYKAVHELTNQTVAVKVFNKAKMSHQNIENVKNEIQIQKKLFHSNIARIYEFYETQNKIYIFMEYCHNGELFNLINSRGTLSENKAGKIFKQILLATKYLKSQRIFHRDIKCENILFDKNWNVKLVDFGFATKEQNECFSTTFCGSPSYTAPEMFQKPKYKAEAVDVWCLGITLYAMLYGALPFDGKEFKNTKRNIIELKYEFKNPISTELKELFKKIFVEDYQRATIEELEETDFIKNCHSVSENFINTQNEEITVDPDVLELIETQFPQKSTAEIIESVTQFRLDQNYSLYYLMVQSSLARGKKVKFDIGSPNFEKRKKKMGQIKLRKLGDNYKRLMVDKNTIEMMESQIQPKKTQIRIRPSLVSIDLASLKTMRRNNSVDSPRKRN